MAELLVLHALDNTGASARVGSPERRIHCNKSFGTPRILNFMVFFILRLLDCLLQELFLLTTENL